MSQVAVHHPSSYGYSGQVGLPATVTGGVSATYSWQNLNPSVGHTVTWGGGAPATDTFTSSASGTGSATHTYANGTYVQVVTETATGRKVAQRTFTVPYAGGAGFAPKAVGKGAPAIEKAPEPAPPAENGNGDYFDPSDYTVDEVVAYAEAYDDQLEDIIAAEEAGKARSTLLSHLYTLRP